MKKTIFSQLESSALFAGLDANSIEKHLSMIQYSVKKVPAKTIFLSENEPLCEMAPCWLLLLCIQTIVRCLLR